MSVVAHAHDPPSQVLHRRHHGREPLGSDSHDRPRDGRRDAADGRRVGESGQQTAPLGRALIGGLRLAMVATLSALSSIYAIIRGRAGRRSPSLDSDDLVHITAEQP